MSDLALIKEKILKVDSVFRIIAKKNELLNKEKESHQRLFSDYRDQCSKNEQLQNDLDTYKKLFEENSNMYMGAKKILDKLQPELNKLRSEHKQCQNTIKEHKKTEAALNKKIHTEKERCFALRDDLAKANRETKVCITFREKEVQSVRDECGRLEEENKGLIETNEKLRGIVLECSRKPSTRDASQQCRLLEGEGKDCENVSVQCDFIEFKMQNEKEVELIAKNVILEQEMRGLSENECEDLLGFSEKEQSDVEKFHEFKLNADLFNEEEILAMLSDVTNCPEAVGPINSNSPTPINQCAVKSFASVQVQTTRTTVTCATQTVANISHRKTQTISLQNDSETQTSFEQNDGVTQTCSKLKTSGTQTNSECQTDYPHGDNLKDVSIMHTTNTEITVDGVDAENCNESIGVATNMEDYNECSDAESNKPDNTENTNIANNVLSDNKNSSNKIEEKTLNIENRSLKRPRKINNPPKRKKVFNKSDVVAKNSDSNRKVCSVEVQTESVTVSAKPQSRILRRRSNSQNSPSPKITIKKAIEVLKRSKIDITLKGGRLIKYNKQIALRTKDQIQRRMEKNIMDKIISYINENIGINLSRSTLGRINHSSMESITSQSDTDYGKLGQKSEFDSGYTSDHDSTKSTVVHENVALEKDLLTDVSSNQKSNFCIPKNVTNLNVVNNSDGRLLQKPDVEDNINAGELPKNVRADGIMVLSPQPKLKVISDGKPIKMDVVRDDEGVGIVSNDESKICIDFEPTSMSRKRDAELIMDTLAERKKCLFKNKVGSLGPLPRNPEDVESLSDVDDSRNLVDDILKEMKSVPLLLSPVKNAEGKIRAENTTNIKNVRKRKCSKTLNSSDHRVFELIIPDKSTISPNSENKDSIDSTCNKIKLKTNLQTDNNTVSENKICPLCRTIINSDDGCCNICISRETVSKNDDKIAVSTDDMIYIGNEECMMELLDKMEYHGKLKNRDTVLNEEVKTGLLKECKESNLVSSLNINFDANIVIENNPVASTSSVDSGKEKESAQPFVEAVIEEKVTVLGGMEMDKNEHANDLQETNIKQGLMMKINEIIVNARKSKAVGKKYAEKKKSYEPWGAIKVAFKNAVRFKGVEEYTIAALTIFKTIDTGKLISYLLHEVIEDECEIMKGLSPFEPFLSITQRTVLGLMLHLERSHDPNIIDEFLTMCEHRLLFNEKDPVAVEHVVRLYASICKMRKLKCRLRRLIFDGLYFMGDLVLPLIYYTLTAWIQVLKRNGSRNDELHDPFAKILVQMVHTKSGNLPPEYCLFVLKNLLQVYYRYPKEMYNENDLIKEFLEKYMCTLSGKYEFVILILCKNNKVQWVIRQLALIDELKLILKNEEVIEALAELKGKIQKQIGIKKTQ